MHVTLLLLSRIQFAFTIAFHILFPAFSIGLITYIAVFEAIWIKSKNVFYQNICKFWTKILALTFGMGIVSGIVMEFQLGTNWAHYTAMSGNVLGVLFSYEVLTAFFIEAGFLGVMFFGWNKVSSSLHFTATLLALTGVTLSAFWIMSANSWMQYPAGVIFNNHTFIVNNWFNVIFNPLFIPRFLHMLIAAYLSTALVIMAICAYYLLKNKYLLFSKTCFSAALISLIIFIPLQFLIGDEVGLRIHHYQPLKTAAIEGIWETQRGAPLLLAALPDQNKQMNHFTFGIPKLGALINTHHWDGELIGLKSVSPNEQPPVIAVFLSFRVMIGAWVLMMMITFMGILLYFKKTIYHSRWYLKCCIIGAPLGFIALLTGWFTAEFGRQPWVIYHFLKTSAAHSDIQIHNLLISLILIIGVYGIVFGYFYFRYFFKIIRLGPTDKPVHPGETFVYLPLTRIDDSKQ